MEVRTNRQPPQQRDAPGNKEHDPGDFSDMHEEIRILLPAAQVLTAFLVILPFNSGFAEVRRSVKWVFLATFICSLSSLVLLSAPAAHHRLEHPLVNRKRFKAFSTRIIIAGLVMLSIALVLATELVISMVFGHVTGIVVAVFVGLLIGVVWWLLPLLRKGKE